MADSNPTPQESTTPDPVTTNGQTVTLLNAEVLNSDISGMANPLADQAAAMMIQDMQSFLQGNEQVLIIAIGRATAMLLNDSTAKTGENALKVYGTLLTTLSGYSAEIGKSATGIASGFKG